MHAGGQHGQGLRPAGRTTPEVYRGPADFLRGRLIAPPAQREAVLRRNPPRRHRQPGATLPCPNPSVVVFMITESFGGRSTASSVGHCNSSSLSACAGVFHARVLRGRPLSSAATASRSFLLCRERLVPLGKYWRSRPLVFSLVPRCQGLCGSQK